MKRIVVISLLELIFREIWNKELNRNLKKPYSCKTLLSRKFASLTLFAPIFKSIYISL